MRAIMVMYDSLNRHMLEPYGCDWTKTPNFRRLAERATQFENCYVGSMPCMPARRDLHTGRPNFLHRSWGPLEPFDDSMPEILKQNGICTHLVSDHQHYWEDGGGTYHTRYSSWEVIRGQEGDPWKENLLFEPEKRTPFERSKMVWEFPMGKAMHTHDQVNRSYMDTEEKTAQARTFSEGLEFIDTNHPADNWFLHIECFDPHEPFFVDEKYQKDFDGPLHGEDALGIDWPPYAKVNEGKEVVQSVRNRYAALLEKCDAYLGKVLDKMDEYDMWKDTMLVVCTDHGFLLGEHDWWGKTAMPCWNEIAHTPLYVYDPRLDCAGKKCDGFVQMADLAPTLLEYFGIDIPKDMTGKPVRNIMEGGVNHEYVVFGFHGDEIIINDGKYLYMNAPEHPEAPYYEYTLMPTHMRARFSVKELENWEKAEPFSFTKGLSTMKIRCLGSMVGGAAEARPSRLYDLENDPGQLNEIDDLQIVRHMKELIAEYMKETDAPKELYYRYGIEEAQMKQYLVFDFGGTFIKYALMSENAEILEQDKVPAPVDSLESLLAAVKGIGDRYQGRFCGAAVSMPGRLDTAKGIAFTGGSYRFIRNIPMGDELEKVLRVPVTIGNDGKCAANAEIYDGALADVENGGVIVLGTGTGGGIMLNRKIWMGTTGGGGELSHLVADMNAFSTAGTDLQKIISTIWAGHTSATGLIAKYAVKKGHPEEIPNLDGVKLFEAYDAGDEAAKEALEEFGRITAAGIYSIQSVLDLEKYAIGGGISARKEVTDIIREKVDEVFNQFGGRPFMIPEIVTCRYRNDANLIGALRFHLDRIG